jgi:hypothetical protein
MFSSLEESIKRSDSKESSRERIGRWAIIVGVGGILLFAGLYASLQYLQNS